MGPFWLQCCTILALGRPKDAREIPRDPQSTPKSARRESQDTPKDTQRSPKVPQGSPKGPQRTPKGPPRPPQERPKDPQRTVPDRCPLYLAGPCESVVNSNKNEPRDKPVSTWNGKRGVVIHIACVWVCSGFTSGSAKVLGGEGRLPKDTPRHIRDEFKENQSNMQ